MITGATGFLGFQILKSLSRKNHKIFIVVRKNSKNLFKLKMLDKKKIKIFYCEDIFNSKKKYFNDFELCILSALLISLWPLSPTGSFFNNWMSIVYYFPLGILIWQRAIKVKNHEIKSNTLKIFKK